MIVQCMWLWVIYVKYIVESIVLGKSKHLDGKSVGLKISNLTIAQYIDDVQLATQ